MDSSRNLAENLKAKDRRHPLVTLTFIILGLLAMLSFSGLGLLLKNSFSNQTPYIEITPSLSPMPLISASPTITPTPLPSPKTSYNSHKSPSSDPKNLKVPILMYHHVQNLYQGNQLDKDLSVSTLNFNLQMALIKKEGFQTIKLAQLVREDFSIPHPIVITFDDGYSDVYENAYPIMQKYGFSGTLFVIDKFIGKSGYLDLTMIKKLAEEGWEIGGHSRTHKNLAALDEKALKQEIVLPDYINSPVFAYPAGKSNEAVRNYLKNVGVIAAVTTHYGFYKKGDDPLLIKRIRIRGGDSIETFAKKILASKDTTR